MCVVLIQKYIQEIWSCLNDVKKRNCNFIHFSARKMRLSHWYKACCNFAKKIYYLQIKIMRYNLNISYLSTLAHTPNQFKSKKILPVKWITTINTITNNGSCSKTKEKKQLMKTEREREREKLRKYLINWLILVGAPFNI